MELDVSRSDFILGVIGAGAMGRGIAQIAAHAALDEKLDPQRTVAIDTLFGLEKRRTLMTTPVTARVMRDAAHGLFGADGVPVTVIRDSPGFVAQRVVATIVNIGCDIAQQRIATPKDIGVNSR